jgi:hypothetical protein
MNLKARVKRFLVRHFLLQQFCRDCGRKVFPWITDDATWEAGSNGEKNALCLECFALRAKAAGIVSFTVDLP